MPLEIQYNYFMAKDGEKLIEAVVIEGNVDVRQLLCGILDKLNVQVTVIEEASAIPEIKNGSPELWYFDLQHPDIPFTKVRERFSHFSNVTVLVGDDDQNSIVAKTAISEGAWDVVFKSTPIFAEPKTSQKNNTRREKLFKKKSS
jgi:DNA-binding NtrC family response regulator